MGRVRVGVVDAHAGTRLWLRARLSAIPDVEPIAEAEGPFEAFSLLDDFAAAKVPVAVLFLDLPADPEDARALVELFCERDPLLRVITIARRPDPAAVQAALNAGACGCVSKDAAVEELAWAVAGALRGEVVLGRRI
jgi:DNA-binding NarL/FixJ family response regulator